MSPSSTGLTTVSTTPASRPTTEGPSHAPPDRFGVIPWEGGERPGPSHDPRSAYVETFWGPIVGPSTTLLLRRLADEFDAHPDGFEIDTVALSRDIGLGPRIDHRSSFARTLDRSQRFRLVRLDGSLLHVRQRLPSLGSRLAGKLSPRLRALHRSWTIEPADDGAERRVELVRAAHLARTLLTLGESEHDAERQLHRWHFHPSVAWHAVQWALTDSDPLP